jgi:hypothetical protein
MGRYHQTVAIVTWLQWFQWFRNTQLNPYDVSIKLSPLWLQWLQWSQWFRNTRLNPVFHHLFAVVVIVVAIVATESRLMT